MGGSSDEKGSGKPLPDLFLLWGNGYSAASAGGMTDI